MKNVIVYTSDTCAYCDEAKSYLKAKGISFEEKNIKEAEARKTLISLGIRSVPVIFVGEEKLIGFDREKLDALL